MAVLRQLYIQVIIAILLAIVLGLVAPETAIAMKPLGDAFIALLRMLLAPIIFCSVVLGLTHVGDMRQLGRLAVKALVYFEVLTTIGWQLASWRSIWSSRAPGCMPPISPSTKASPR